MRRVTHVVVHTAAAAREGRPFDCSAADIDSWHKNKGWNGIGYHWVVRFDGSVEQGRPESQIGAGVFLFNRTTVHVCLSGHGDLAAPTWKQWTSAVKLAARILERHGLIEAFLRNPNRVIGHREAWTLSLVPSPIRKSCPGRLVDMRAFRRAVLEEIGR